MDRDEVEVHKLAKKNETQNWRTQQTFAKHIIIYICETHHNFCEKQHNICETRNNSCETGHKIIEAQQKNAMHEREESAGEAGILSLAVDWGEY